MPARKSYHYNIDSLNIPAKANRILNVVLVGMLLIVFRIWHLSVVQYDEKLDESRKPQRRIVMEAAKRATIRDRFNIPLAINKMQYNVAIHYTQIKQIPSIAWETDENGKRVKHFKRKEYITTLSNLLAKELDMDAERIEDLIHAKASFYNQIPFVLKEDIAESQYYRLKMLEKDWPGIGVQHIPQRNYPLDQVGGDILGYMGAINHQEYESIIREIKALENYLENVDEGEIIALPEGIESTEQARRRLKDLQELSYSVNDSIGKTGIEGRFEKTLRGFRGKRSYYSDAKGNFLRELPGTREPLSGKRLMLSISAELQEYAEELLIKNEKIRRTSLSHLGPVKRTIPAQKQPWIKGGAIIAMDPNNGEVIAMASLPRINPNDFIHSGNPEDAKRKTSNVEKWLENDNYLADIWNQQRPLERESFERSQGIYTETLMLTWPTYLEFVLGKESSLRNSILPSATIQDAVTIQKAVEALMQVVPQIDIYALFNVLYRGENHQDHGKKLSASHIEDIERQLAASHEVVQKQKRILAPYLENLHHSYDQALLVDLLRIVVDGERFSNQLLTKVGKLSLTQHKDLSSALVKIQDVVKKMTKELFHELDFKEWRKAHEKDFLKLKREEEKLNHRYAKPYIDYTDQMENELFKAFWNTYRWDFILTFLRGGTSDLETTTLQPYFEYFQSWQREFAQGAHQEIEWANAYQSIKEGIKFYTPETSIDYLRTMRSFHELDRPLLGKYRYLRKNSDQSQLEKHLAAAYYPKFGFSYGRSQTYRQAATQGSIFKMITAYEALIQCFHTLQDEGKNVTELNPLEMIDTVHYKGKDLYVGFTITGQPLPRYYKEGRLPRSAGTNYGKLDLLKALEYSSNPYFSLIAGEVLHSPNDLADAARKFSFGSRTGIDLPGEISGKIPDDLASNRTGLYSMAIGQHTLVVTPLQTTVMFSALANGGKILKPKIVEMMVGKEPQRGRTLVAENQYFPYQESLQMVNIDFPLFIAADAEQQKSLIKPIPTEIKSQVFLPDVVRRMLLDGMCRVNARTHNEGMGSLRRSYKDHPDAITDYAEFKYQLMGKTSTAESIENIDLDLDKGTNIYTHVWFGGIVYEQDVLDRNENRFVFRDSFGSPELVVVIYLRYGSYGKEASPIAAQMAKKWREIKQRHAKPKDSE